MRLLTKLNLLACVIMFGGSLALGVMSPKVAVAAACQSREVCAIRTTCLSNPQSVCALAGCTVSPETFCTEANCNIVGPNTGYEVLCIYE